MRKATIMFLGVLSVVAALAWWGPPRAEAGVNITPAYVELSLDRGRPSGTFYVTNNGDQEERFRIKTLHFNMTRTGGLQQLPANSENSLAGWLRLSPREFTVAPRTRRVVRFSVAPKQAVKDGEYWGAVIVESLRRRVGRADDKEAGVAANVQFVSTIIVPVFGIKGNVRYSGNLSELQLVAGKEGAIAQVVLTNTGTGRLILDGDCEVFDEAGEKVATGKFRSAYVFRGSDRIFSMDLDNALPEGTYTVRASIQSKELEQPFQMEQKVQWEPAPQQAQALE